MVAAISTAAECGNARTFPKVPTSPLEDYSSSTAAAGRLARSKEVTSRYLSSSLLSPSKPNSSTISTISSSSSSSSSSPSFTPRRFPSPLHNPLPKTPSTLPKRRSQSVDRTRPSPAITVSDSVPAVAEREALRTTTRSLAVSFQGESFFFQTSKAKPSPRKLTPECRKSNGIENSQPDEQQLRRWPTAKAIESNLVSRSLDCSVDREDPMLLTVRLLQKSLMLDEAVYFDNGDRSRSLDSDSLSSGSSSSLPEPKLRTKPRGICVPARFRQESGWPRPHAETPQKTVTGKQQSLDNTQLASPRFMSSPQCRPKSSLAKQAAASRTRSNIMESHSNGPIGNAPSIISFASEVRRAKKSESRIEDAHMLRLFHNRYLQWRYVNSCSENALSTQLVNTKNKLYNAWISISELHNLVMDKKTKLRVQMQNLKLTTILKEQITYLDEWYTLDKDHESSLRGTIDTLEASTLRLPVLGEAKVDIQEVKAAVNSATGVMQAMSTCICSSLSNVEGITSLASQLAKSATVERAFLDQSRDLLSVVAALQVKQCSLRSYLLQLGRETSLTQLQ